MDKLYLTAAKKRRRQQVIRYRAKGYTFAKIGELLGISRQRVHQLVNGK